MQSWIFTLWTFRPMGFDAGFVSFVFAIMDLVTDMDFLDSHGYFLFRLVFLFELLHGSGWQIRQKYSALAAQLVRIHALTPLTRNARTNIKRCAGTKL